MASPRRDPPPPAPPHRDVPLPTTPLPDPPHVEAVTITIKTERTNKLKDSPQNSVREQAQKIETVEKQKSLEKDEQCYVRNSSFLSRDIEAQKVKETVVKGKESPPKKVMPPPRKERSSPKKEPSPPKESLPLKKEVSPPMELLPPKKDISPPKEPSLPKKTLSPPKKEPALPKKEPTPPKKESSPPKKESSPPKSISPPKKEVMSPPVAAYKLNRTDSKIEENSVAMRASRIEAASPPKKEVTSPPVSAFKINRTDSKNEDNTFPVKVTKRENSIGKETAIKIEKLSLVTDGAADQGKVSDSANSSCNKVEDTDKHDKNSNNEESNGVGDKIKKFEKAAEDASANVGRLSRPGSVRGRSRTERLGSDSKDDFPPPATPFKDNIHFELGTCDKTEHVNYTVERQQSLTKNNSPNLVATKWQRSDSNEEKTIQKPEPLKIIKPEFKPMPSPVDVTIRSPSLGAKIPDQFPSHGTAFRNVASPDQARSNTHKFNEDVNTQNNLKACKFKNKEKYSVSKGSSYFTRGSEEIWLVKKKDIEEIEERVLDSFRRAGGNICMRSESMRPSSDSGQSVSFSHATMGRNKRQMYARSESLDPQWAGARAQTLKRQTSVACTCGHDKKTRAKSAGTDTTPRPRSRSHGDDNNQAHVLDKYETLV